ncbi:MAG: rhombosortase [Desulfobacteraceae bacterium]|jgi:rhomboid family GlyGly-CTERM serine protease
MNASTNPFPLQTAQKMPERRTPAGLGQTRPLWVWAAVLIIVNLPLIWGEIRTELIFLPDAVSSGQWWRTVTYPLVHLSWYHLLLDAGGFLLLLHCLEEKRPWARMLLMAGAGAGSLALTLALDPFVFEGGLSGLSGIAHGLMAITALEMLRHAGQRRWGALSLALVVSKSAYELWSGQVFFEFLHMGMCGRPLAASHAGGVLGGAIVFAVLNLCPHSYRAPKTSAVGRQTDRTSNRSSIQSNIQQHIQKTIQISVRALTRIMYRVRYEGLERIPSKGAAVLVCNHVSYVDWLIIASGCKRPVHFVMHASIYRLPVLRWIFRLAKVIPVESGRKNPAMLRRTFSEISAVLASGGLICIFPEGHLTHTGRIHRFRAGIEKIVQRNPVPVIPLALRGLWGSFFSYKGGAPMRRLPKKFWPRIGLAVGNRVPARLVTAPGLRCAVEVLHGGGN